MATWPGSRSPATQIVRMDATTGAASALVTGTQPPAALSVDEASVFWITVDFDLYRVDK